MKIAVEHFLERLMLSYQSGVNIWVRSYFSAPGHDNLWPTIDMMSVG